LSTALKSPPARRTQRERREATIRKLIDATIESLLELGYKGTSVSEICKRSGLSHGALFRFFPSVLDLVLAASAEVAQRQIEAFEKRFAKAKHGPDPVRAALELLRTACRSPTNAVFYELLLAARTDSKLKSALKVSMRKYYDTIRAAALTVPGMEALPEELLDVLLFSAIHLFDGETLARTVLPQPEIEQRRMDLIARLITHLGAH
jgi:AcrR family transcriptional regulator